MILRHDVNRRQYRVVALKYSVVKVLVFAPLTITLNLIGVAEVGLEAGR